MAVTSRLVCFQFPGGVPVSMAYFCVGGRARRGNAVRYLIGILPTARSGKTRDKSTELRTLHQRQRIHVNHHSSRAPLMLLGETPDAREQFIERLPAGRLNQELIPV